MPATASSSSPGRCILILLSDGWRFLFVRELCCSCVRKRLCKNCLIVSSVNWKAVVDGKLCWFKGRTRKTAMSGQTCDRNARNTTNTPCHSSDHFKLNTVTFLRGPGGVQMCTPGGVIARCTLAGVKSTHFTREKLPLGKDNNSCKQGI